MAWRLSTTSDAVGLAADFLTNWLKYGSPIIKTCDMGGRSLRTASMLEGYWVSSAEIDIAGFEAELSNCISLMLLDLDFDLKIKDSSQYIADDFEKRNKLKCVQRRFLH